MATQATLEEVKKNRYQFLSVSVYIAQIIEVEYHITCA